MCSTWFNCYFDYYLFEALYSIDIDECTANISTCSQLCINTPGSYLCDCNQGYNRNSDGISCRGKVSHQFCVTNTCLKSETFNFFSADLSMSSRLRGSKSNDYLIIYSTTEWKSQFSRGKKKTGKKERISFVLKTQTSKYFILIAYTVYCVFCTARFHGSIVQCIFSNQFAENCNIPCWVWILLYS